MSDEAGEALVRACLQGDPASWEALTRTYSDLVSRVLRRVVQRQGTRLGDTDVEEMTSGVFASLVEHDGRKLKRYDPRFPFAAYLRLIARGHALDALRARRRRALAESAAPSPPPSPDPALGERLDELLAGLDARERAVIRLYFLADRTCPEIAQLIRIPENTVFSLLRRTLEKLRQEGTP
jgi:RNA polymerase sigma-70 factor (ECF subfamily)